MCLKTVIAWVTCWKPGISLSAMFHMKKYNIGCLKQKSKISYLIAYPYS